MQSFEDLKIRQQGIEVAKQVYALAKDPTIRLERSLKDQIKRSSVSISSNIAEGFERRSHKEYSRFLYIAKGSCGELRSQLYLLQELYAIDTRETMELCTILSKQIYALIRKIARNYRN